MNHCRIFLTLYPLHLENYLLHVKSTLHTFILPQKIAWFVHSPQQYQDTLQSRGETVSYAFLQSIHTTARFFFLIRTSGSIMLSINNRLLVPLHFRLHSCSSKAITFSFLNIHRFYLLIYLAITSILRVNM